MRRANHDVSSVCVKYVAAFGYRLVSNALENHVVSFLAFGEVLFRVIDDRVRANRLDELHISRAAYARYVRSEIFGELHRKCAYAAGRAVNQDFLSRLNFSF